MDINTTLNRDSLSVWPGFCSEWALLSALLSLQLIVTLLTCRNSPRLTEPLWPTAGAAARPPEPLPPPESGPVLLLAVLLDRNLRAACGEWWHQRVTVSALCAWADRSHLKVIDSVTVRPIRVIDQLQMINPCWSLIGSLLANPLHLLWRHLLLILSIRLIGVLIWSI